MMARLRTVPWWMGLDRRSAHLEHQLTLGPRTAGVTFDQGILS